MNEEPFGPVALINPFRTEEEMIAEANRLPYGLASYSWTNDPARQKRLARQVEAGMFCINTVVLGGPTHRSAASSGPGTAPRTARKE